MNMENMSYEVFDSIITNYADDDEELLYIFEYLYKTTTDKTLKDMIQSWTNDNNYCLDCWIKKKSYDYKERHNELDGYWYEHFVEYLCPNCGF